MAIKYCRCVNSMFSALNQYMYVLLKKIKNLKLDRKSKPNVHIHEEKLSNGESQLHL